jgi:hypothetical protein
MQRTTRVTACSHDLHELAVGEPFLTKAQTCKALFYNTALGVDAFGDQVYSQFPSVMGQLIVP